MGNREECPVCKGYGSDLYTAFKNGDDCLGCGASYEAIQSFFEIERQRKAYLSNQLSIELVKENESLKKELVLKRDRYKKMQDMMYGTYWRMEEMVKELDKEWMNSIKAWDKEE